ncbi:DUF2950 domain-containing protein [Syntrophobacter fumaroxidans]|uniref:DUF2950 domain-containing protein n=1 Tax=Syntrophobacter fumaroxidans (strain DSM 10017 / MPOB) TaxID=335543 RepID=A0LI99_SYNFM|nr:DUF2950 domain-containing protein [Syntrophobacter fumaroxidans]ABK17151.1 conserved hypothetical protein [Syntrophobacter fumaroxidans MPOB]
MLLFIQNMKQRSRVRRGLTALALALPALVLCCGVALAAGTKQKVHQRTFASPEAAVRALVVAVEAGDMKELSEILGPEGQEIVSSGDEVADRNGRELFVRLYEEKNAVKRDGEKKAVLELGKDGWPLPIPIVRAGNAWRFDTKQGKQEILNRRIGRNELGVIQACLAYFDAQREYASMTGKGGVLPEYAQKFWSDPGTKNGLYWEAKPGEPQSPLGPLVAAAQKRGYTRKQPTDRPTPYLGYYYKILTAQGKDAPGGAYSYVVNGKMVGGFALVAWPDEYGVSGITTFMVSHDGVVYEKDLGRKTEAAVQSMTAFDPDRTWRKVERKYLEPAAGGGGV